MLELLFTSPMAESLREGVFRVPQGGGGREHSGVEQCWPTFPVTKLQTCASPRESGVQWGLVRVRWVPAVPGNMGGAHARLSLLLVAGGGGAGGQTHPCTRS